VGLLESALDVLLDHQAGFVVSVDRFRPACVYMMPPAEIYLESPGFGDVPLPWAKIYMVFFRPLDAVVSVKLLTQVASAVPWLDDARRVFLSGLLVPFLRKHKVSQ